MKFSDCENVQNSEFFLNCLRASLFWLPKAPIWFPFQTWVPIYELTGPLKFWTLCLWFASVFVKFNQSMKNTETAIMSLHPSPFWEFHLVNQILIFGDGPPSWHVTLTLLILRSSTFVSYEGSCMTNDGPPRFQADITSDNPPNSINSPHSWCIS